MENNNFFDGLKKGNFKVKIPDEEIKSGIFRDKKGTYLKLNKKDRASLRSQYYTVRYKKKGTKAKGITVHLLARNRKEVQKEAKKLGYEVISAKKTKHKLHFSF